MAIISAGMTILRQLSAPSKLRVKSGVKHAFDSLRESELIPGAKAGAEEIQELARLASASFGHAVGTCKMGVDKLAVVDPELRVHGILGLRVADASVMPRIIAGPRCQSDSRPGARHLMTGNPKTSLTIDCHQHNFRLFWQETEDANAGGGTCAASMVQGNKPLVHG